MDIAAVSEGIQLLALRPGDRLAILMPESFDIDREDLAEMRRVLKEAWPEVVSVFFTGGIELAVVRSEES